MTAKLRVSDEASEDISDHAMRLARANRSAATRFIGSVRKTLGYIEAFPTGGTLFEVDDPDIPAMRIWPVSGFRKYVIFYRYDGAVIEILRVLDGTRDLRAFFRRQ